MCIACQKSPITQAATSACACIENSENKGRKTIQDCIVEIVIQDEVAIKNYVAEDDISLTVQEAELRQLYVQLVAMTMLEQCPHLIKRK